MPEPLKVDAGSIYEGVTYPEFYCPCGEKLTIQIIDRGSCTCLRSVSIVIGEPVGS